MSRACAVCEHPKVDAINAALASGRAPAIIARGYRLEPPALDAHRKHLTQAAQGGPHLAEAGDTRQLTPPPQVLFSADAPVPADPERRVRFHLEEAARAWTQVEPDRRTWDRLQLILEEAFASEEMGL